MRETQHTNIPLPPAPLLPAQRARLRVITDPREISRVRANHGRGVFTAHEACKTITTTGILTSQKRSEHPRSCAGSQTDPSTDTEQYPTVCATTLHADRTRASQSIFTTRTARRHWHGIARRQSSRPAQSQAAWPDSTHNANAVRQRMHTPCPQIAPGSTDASESCGVPFEKCTSPQAPFASLTY